VEFFSLEDLDFSGNNGFTPQKPEYYKKKIRLILRDINIVEILIPLFTLF
jgi:hypothetical protein